MSFSIRMYELVHLSTAEVTCGTRRTVLLTTNKARKTCSLPQISSPSIFPNPIPSLMPCSASTPPLFSCGPHRFFPSYHPPHSSLFPNPQPQQAPPTSLFPGKQVRLKADLHLLLLQFQFHQYYPHSVAENLLWFPFPHWPYPQQITKTLYSNFPSPNSSEYPSLWHQQALPLKILAEQAKKTGNTKPSHSLKIQGGNRNQTTKCPLNKDKSRN